MTLKVRCNSLSSMFSFRWLYAEERGVLFGSRSNFTAIFSDKNTHCCQKLNVLLIKVVSIYFGHVNMSLFCPKYPCLGCSRGSHDCTRQREPSKHRGAKTCLLWGLPKVFFLTFHCSWLVQGWETKSKSLPSRDCGMRSRPVNLLLSKWLHNKAQDRPFLCLCFLLCGSKKQKKPVLK